MIFSVSVFTVYQAALSAAVSVFLACLAAPGYASLLRAKKIVKLLLLLPNMLSSILVVLCLLLSFDSFPYGLSGIILGHVFLNVGLCTVLIGEKWYEIESNYSASAKILGAQNLKFIFKIILPLLWPQLRYCFVVVFALCMTSFAIPLVLGGGPQYSTLEVLVNEMVRANADVNGALMVALTQLLLQLFVFFLIVRPAFFRTEFRNTKITQIKTHWAGLFFLFFALVMILWPLFQLIRISGEALQAPIPFEAMGNSLIVATISAVLIGLLLLALTAQKRTYAWLTRVPSPSGVAVGLIFLIFIGFQSENFLIPLILAHVLVLFLPILRLAYPSIEIVRNQSQKVIQQLGAGRVLSLKKVYLPQSMPFLVPTMLIVFCWSAGDFSVAQILAPTESTLPLYIHSLISHYRLEQAALSSLILFCLSLLALFLLEKADHGLR